MTAETDATLRDLHGEIVKKVIQIKSDPRLEFGDLVAHEGKAYVVSDISISASKQGEDGFSLMSQITLSGI